MDSMFNQYFRLSTKKPEPLVPQYVTLFGNRVAVVVIS
jgi:hypothetical protein